ncbi:MAG TPA: hypothetical protein VFQ28_09490 [Gaiella sp.]|nr:hypothetical protein [Gaiella sp.]
MRRTGASQGEALATWSAWAVVLLAIVITYARLEPAELYHVSREGVGGGLSRALVEVDFPVALVAIALVLVALDALPRPTWWVGGPAIALCAVVAWPGVVDQDDLDARWVNAIPAAGVVLAAGLTLAAARRAGAGVASRLPLDPLRLGLAVVAVVLSVPWLAAEAGLYLPEGVWIMERPGLEADGTTIAAVHLGHHHGLDGALIVLSALLLTRPRLHAGPRATATRLYLSLAFAYGAVNLAQDYWNEQLVKRGWLDWRIPSALEPRPEPVWLAILGLAAVTAFALRAERAP